MPALRLHQLPWPDPAYRGDLLNSAFETFDASKAQDVLRAKTIRNTAGGTGSLWGQAALQLADEIDPEITPNPSTLASHRYFRDLRIRFTGAMLQLVDSVGVENVVRVDIIKPGLERDLEGLMAEHPARAMNEMRTDFIRAGMSNCDGFLLGAYHNEFDPLYQGFQGHGHFLVGGEYIPALQKLRGFKAYQPTERVKRPIRVNKNLTNLPHALSYILKSYWPSRPMLPLGSGGRLKRPRSGQRLPEPYHTQVLMWFDQFDLSDLCLLMGVRLGRDGFVMTGKGR